MKKIEFKSYRNLASAEFIPCDKTNVIYGENAQGKTNLLEMIWLFSGNKSFRNARDTDQINYEERSTTIQMDFFSQEREQSMELVFSTEGRRVFLNGVEKNSVASFLGVFNAVMFHPDHLSLVKGSPSDRRRFIDSAIYQIRPAYAKTLVSYNKTLVQRNALVKDIPNHPELMDTLAIWDEKLAKYAAVILVRRSEYLKKLCSFAYDFYAGISGAKEKLSISYESSFYKKAEVTEQAVAMDLLKKLRSSRKEDLKCGYTTVGPHRDDIDFFLDSKNAKLLASQGQQRSIVLSMKLAEANMIKEETGESPVVLLDDVLSELDKMRRDYIVNNLDGFQVFITSCDLSPTTRILKGKKFKVANGKIQES